MGCCCLHKSSIRVVFLIIFYIIYIIIGAAIFSALEYDNEQNLIDDLRQKRRLFLNNRTCINGMSSHVQIAAKKFHDFLSSYACL